MKTRSVVLATTLAIVLAIPGSGAQQAMHVALVGDSLAYGAGDEAGKGIGGRLEPVLRTRGIKSIVTTNLGRTGATTADLTAALRVDATRKQIARADVIILSIGANDVRSMLLGYEPLRSPLIIADEVLQAIDVIVRDIRTINPRSRILILGAYVPVPDERASMFLEPLVLMWDGALAAQFEDDPLVSIVPISDIINGPERLSTLDSFHPGGDAYQETAQRIADLLVAPNDLSSTSPGGHR